MPLPSRSATKTSSRKLTAKLAVTENSHVDRIRNEENEPHLGIPTHELRRAQATPATEGCYVYGIVGGEIQFRGCKSVLGGEADNVFTVCEAGLAAVVSKVKTAILEPTRENALAHEHVVEKVMQSGTIIPMSFGTVFRTDDDIRAVLRTISPTLKDVLARMKDKIELGLKVSWDRDKAIERVTDENEHICRFKIELSNKRLQSTYFARMQLGRMIEQALAEFSANILLDIYEALRPICLASRDNRPIGESMIMNAAFLLEQKKEQEFGRIVHKISEKYKDVLAFRYSGPGLPTTLSISGSS